MKSPRLLFSILFVIGFCLLFALRWPGWTTPYSMNPDEELLVASVVTMGHRGLVPWVSFDTTTIGPATSWLLYAAATLLGGLSYQSVHVLAALLWAAMGMVCVGIGLTLTTPRAAITSFLLVAGTFVLTLRPNYLHFNSEILPSFLLSVAALSLCVFFVKPPHPSCRHLSLRHCLLFLCGFSCSTALLAKLQSLPIAMFVLSAALVSVLREGRRGKVYCVLSLSMGFLILPIPLFLWLASLGELSSAWNSYFVAGLSYGSGQAWNGERLAQMRQDIWGGWSFFRPFLLAAGLIMVACPLARPTNLNSRQIAIWVALGGWLLAALLTALLPAGRWEHHGTFIVAPAIAFLSYLIYLSSGEGDPVPVRRWKALTTSTTLLGCWIAFSVPLLESLNLRQYSEWSGPSPWHRSLFEKIATESRGAPVAVWGWVPALFADMNLPSASRHMISHFLIDESPAREELRRAYMEDLRATRPLVILDAVCEGFFLWSWGDHPQRRASSFPELRDFLDKHYTKQTMSVFPAELYILKKDASVLVP